MTKREDAPTPTRKRGRPVGCSSSKERHAEWYRLAMSGRTYQSIAGIHGVTPGAARNGVCQYARRHGLPIPDRSGDGEEAYRLRCTGMTWPEVGAACCYSENTAFKTARSYAFKHSLPWPIPIQQQERR